MLRTLTFTIGANEVKTFMYGGVHFEILTASSDITVALLDKTGNEAERLELVREGIYTDTAYGGFTVTNGPTPQTVRLLIGSSSGGNRAAPLTGTVNIGNVPSVTVANVTSVMPSQTATGTQAAKVVTNGSGLLLAALAGRTYLFVQNKSDTGTIWLNILGAGANTASGIKLEPGEFYEMAGPRVTSAAVYAVGDIANNPDVMAVELQ